MLYWNWGPRNMWRHFPHRWQENEDVNYAPIPVNVREEDGQFTLLALMPGVKPADLTVRIEESTLAIRGKTSLSSLTGEPVLEEIVTGTIGRTLNFPSALDPEKIQATLEEGVLSVVLPKAVTAKGKTVEVNVKAAAG